MGVFAAVLLLMTPKRTACSNAIAELRHYKGSDEAEAKRLHKQVLRYGPMALEDCFQYACIAGDAELAAFINAAFDLSNNNIPRHLVLDMFASICRHGHLAIAAWFAYCFKFSASDARHDNNLALASACRYGHLDVAQWLAVTFDLTPFHDNAWCGRALIDACERGRLATAQWIAGRFRPYGQDGASALREACAGGHLSTAQWLVEHFALTAADARSCDALYRACAGAHLRVAEWLVAHFELVRADVRARDCRILKAACAHWRVLVVQWLMNRFELVPDDFHDCGVAIHFSWRPDAKVWLISKIIPISTPK